VVSFIVQLCFIKQTGQRRYKYLALGRDKSYFGKYHSESAKKFSETDIIKMLKYLLCLVDVFCNRQSTYQWVQTVLLNRRNIQMYTPYAGAAGMLLHIDGKFTMVKLKSSLCRKDSFLTGPHILHTLASQ
jgi:hypothetical protein